jgi:CheY-like chemotaxis protein
VLVVDDVAANRLLLGAVLGRAGFAHEAAETGETALSMLASRPYAAVLMDVEMPGIDGLETTRRLRKMPGPVGRVPVIGISAYHNAETERAALGAGMDDFLAKPVSAADLVRVLPKGAKAPA